MTKKRLRILDIVFDFTKENGYPPSLKEIAQIVGTSTITVFEHLQTLERQGFIRRKRHMARSVEIINKEYLDGKLVGKPLTNDNKLLCEALAMLEALDKSGSVDQTALVALIDKIRSCLYPG